MLPTPFTRRMLHAGPKPLRACAGAYAQAVVAADGQTCPADSAMARLHIDATQATADERGTLSLVLRRLNPWTLDATQPALSGLRINDLDGRSYFSADELPPVIDLQLPAGTYHVTVSHGTQQRRYTVALGQGVAVHLQLRGD